MRSIFFLLTFFTFLFIFSCSTRVAVPQTSEPEPKPEAPAKFVPAKEARAIWFSRFEYGNYSTTHDQDSIRNYISGIMISAAEANFNMVIFQVRGNCDAYYTPGLEPWGPLLTGEVGKDPGWDPLAFAIEEAHSHGLELHAWLNTFPAWRGTELPPDTVSPRPAILEHPEWLVADSAGNPMPMSDHYVSFSPGIPAVHDHIINVATDIVKRYAVDGIHFDYIRYPEGSPDRGYSHDSISVARFESEEGNPYHLSWEDWQRQQLNQFVYKAYNAITEINPWVKVSAAVIGNYNRTAWNAYNIVYQDPRRWTEMEKIDFIVPMSYWERAHPTQPFTEITELWHKYYTVNRPIFSGIGAYRFTPGNNLDWSEAEGEIEAIRNLGVPGMVFFDASSLEGYYSKLANYDFATPSNIPAMPWKNLNIPNTPKNIQVDVTKDSVIFSWSIPDTLNGIKEITHINLYASSTHPINTANGYTLEAVLPAHVTRHGIAKDAITEDRYFGISFLDRAWNESELYEVIITEDTYEVFVKSASE